MALLHRPSRTARVFLLCLGFAWLGCAPGDDATGASAPTAALTRQVDGGASLGCGAPGRLFCDDFEAATVGVAPPAPWKVARIGEGKITVDGTTPAHSGTRAVKVSSMGGYQTFLALAGAPLFPASGPRYVRVFMRLAEPMTGGHNTYFKAGAAGATSSEHETRVGVMNGMLMINQPAGDRGFLSNQNFWNDHKLGAVLAPRTWACVEVLLDPANKTLDVWLDGKEIADLHRTDWQQDPLGTFQFGFEKYAGPDADIWYDDIAVSSKPIGCD